jgi:hypothetical protein
MQSRALDLQTFFDASGKAKFRWQLKQRSSSRYFAIAVKWQRVPIVQQLAS